MPASPFSDVSVIYTNIRSIFKKRDDLSSIINSTDAHAIILTETWLNGKVRNDEIFHANKKYNIFRDYRVDKSGGGLLIAVAAYISSFCISTICDLEILWVCIGNNHQKWIIGVCY